MIGTKHDTGKPEWNLLPMQPVEEIVQVLTYGRHKYGANNWKGLEGALERYYAAAMRHLTAYKQYRDGVSGASWIDPESGLSHLSHAATNLIFLMWFEEKQVNDADNACEADKKRILSLESALQMLNDMYDEERQLSDSLASMNADLLRDLCAPRDNETAAIKEVASQEHVFNVSVDILHPRDQQRIRRKAAKAQRQGKGSFKIDGMVFQRVDRSGNAFIE